MERTPPTEAEARAYLRERNNWGRWGPDDQKGAINLITPEKRVQAASLVRSGRAVSLSRDYPKTPGRGNPQPAQHFIKLYDGAVVDFYGISYHGYVTTHVDALCHVWDENGMWNGRDPNVEITTEGANYGAIHHWREGITTRGVLLDVPRFRGEPSVTIEKPVHGWELEAICEAQGVTIEPGDALVVYSGREAWQTANPTWSGYSPPSPGLHASCLPFVRDHDVSALVLGPDGRIAERLRPALVDARRALRVRRRPRRQLPAPAAGGGVRGRGPIRVHADARAAARRRRHRLAGEPDRAVLVGGSWSQRADTQVGPYDILRMQRARSSAAEHPAHNRRRAGSIPAGPTTS